MLKFFILVVLCLVLYQFMNTLIEGLEGEDASTSSDSNSGCSMSLTDRNVLQLNDRVNSLQVQYTDLSSNIITLNKQMEDLMKQNENAASDMVGNQPLDVSTGEDTMPQEVGEDINSNESTDV